MAYNRTEEGETAPSDNSYHVGQPTPLEKIRVEGKEGRGKEGQKGKQPGRRGKREKG